MYHPKNFYNPHSQYFEESPGSYKSDLEILLENFNVAPQIHSHPNYVCNSQSQNFEEPQETYNPNLETLIGDYNSTLAYPQLNSLCNYQSQHFEEPQEFYNFNQNYPQPN